MSGIRSVPHLKGVADHLASKGRYGDTMLVHMNPHEVKALGSLVPGGKLTTNPDTGQPEAFLPFLLPLAMGLGGAFAGPALGIGALAGGAIGAGLGGFGGGLIEGKDVGTSLGRGIVSGLLSYGLGSAGGMLADAGAEAGVSAAMAQPAAEAGASAVSPGMAAMGGSDSAISHALEQGGQSALNSGVGMAPAATAAPSVIPQSPVEALSKMGMDPNRMGIPGDPYSMAPLNGFDQFKNTAGMALEGASSPKNLWNAFSSNAMPIGIGALGMYDQLNQPTGTSMQPPPPGMEPQGIRSVPNTISTRGPRKPAPPVGYRPGIDPEYSYYGYQSGGSVPKKNSLNAYSEKDIPEEFFDERGNRFINLERAEKEAQEHDKTRGEMKMIESGWPIGKSMYPIRQFADGGGLGRAIQGPGDGVSDSIPAMINGQHQSALSDGEYVIPAHAVSALGNGSTSAGIRALDNIVDQVMQKKYGTKDRTPNIIG